MARLPDNLTLTQAEVSQTFNLDELLGVNLSDSPDLKNAIGQALIDRIVERSQSGTDLRGTAFKPYKKSYTESDQFSAFGKSKDVNMTLSGDMLSGLTVLSDAGNDIKIGWDDATNNAKAYNHMVGDTVRKRQFFGITKAAAQEIASEFQDAIDEIKEQDLAPDAITQFIEQIGQATAPAVEQGSGTVLISLEDLFGQS